jgi:acyl-CoA dehydrogenase
MAATEPDAPPHHRYSQIIVPTQTPGLELVRPISVMGHRAGPGHWEVRFKDVRVPLENVLGEPGHGFAIAQARLGPGRIHHCMRWIGQAQRGLDLMCSYAKRRQAFGGPLAEKQTVQNWIAESAAEIQAARLMTLHAAWTIDQKGAKVAKVDISLIKFFGARVLQDVLDRAIQVHGGLGVSDDTPLAFMWRQARAARIYDGPDEVHKLVVARQLLKAFEA